MAIRQSREFEKGGVLEGCPLFRFPINLAANLHASGNSNKLE